MKLTVLAFVLASLVLSLGCTSNTEAPSTSEVIEATADTNSSSTPLPEVNSADIDDSADVAAKSTEVVEEPAALAIPDAALTIGSKAPSLDIEHWISDGDGDFAKVTDFEAGKIYVVEFWATWCGPCVQSMPHLVEFQEKFKDDVQIVSVSDEDLETVTGFLARPYSRGGEDGPQTYGELTSSYCLTTDPDRSVGKDYMEAAGQNGIPACFLVGKTGQIEWVGHPMALEEPLTKVIDGSWDRDAYAAEFKKEQAFGVMMGMIYEAAQAGDMEKASQLVDQARKNAGPRELQQLDQIGMQLQMAPVGKLMQAGDIKGAVAALEKMAGEAEGPAKAQFSAILEQLKSEVAKQAEAGAESADGLVEPAE